MILAARGLGYLVAGVGATAFAHYERSSLLQGGGQPIQQRHVHGPQSPQEGSDLIAQS